MFYSDTAAVLRFLGFWPTQTLSVPGSSMPTLRARLT
jgi:hypothetical protein